MSRSISINSSRLGVELTISNELFTVRMSAPLLSETDKNNNNCKDQSDVDERVVPVVVQGEHVKRNCQKSQH